MASASDPRLLTPFVATGEAVDRERIVRDQNNALKTDEQEWLAAAEAQDAEISAQQKEYFDKLRRRMKPK